MADEKDGEKSKNLSKFPKYGWKVKLDHEFPEKRDQNLQPSVRQVWLLSLLWTELFCRWSPSWCRWACATSAGGRARRGSAANPS